jgi:hypothetical protein
MNLLTLLSALTLHGITVSQQTVPVAANQQVILTVDKPGAFIINATSDSGTSCSLVDKVRGPFMSSGTKGKLNCRMQALLDIGTYQLRLESADKAKGAIQISARELTELNVNPKQLGPKGQFSSPLKSGQQVSLWVKLEKENFVPVHIWGGQASSVRLWSKGVWLSTESVFHNTLKSSTGATIHDWFIDSISESGDYLVTIYGDDNTLATTDIKDENLTVEFGYRAAPVTGFSNIEIPSSEFLAFEVLANKSTLVAAASVQGVFSSPVTVQWLNQSGRQVRDSCTIDSKALMPECVTRASADKSLVLAVRGAAGTRINLEWSASGQTESIVNTGGYYSPAAVSYSFTNGIAGSHFVSLSDVPLDNSAEPLGCLLQEIKSDGTFVKQVAHSVPVLREGEMFERLFNYESGRGSLTFFEVQSSRRMKLTTSGTLKSTCEVYRVDDAGKLVRLTESKAKGGACNESLSLSKGVYQIQLSAGMDGAEKLTLKDEGAGQQWASTSLGNCSFSNVNLPVARYRLITNRVGRVAMRRLEVEPLPLKGLFKHHFTLEPKSKLTLPVLGKNISIYPKGTTPFVCNGKSVGSEGCLLLDGATELKLENPSTETVRLVMSPTAPLSGFQSVTSFNPPSDTTPILGIGKSMWFDFPTQGDAHSALLEVPEAGLYELTTQGLLATQCDLRAPVTGNIASNTSSGRGRNCLIATYLQKGRYLLAVTAMGTSKGRAAFFASKRTSVEVGSMSANTESFFDVPANTLVKQKINVSKAGQFVLQTKDLSNSSLQCRLEDKDGWPLDRVPSTCVVNRELPAGNFQWIQLPATVDSRRRSQLTAVKSIAALSGNGSHPIEFFTWYNAQLGPDGKDEFTFTLADTTDVQVVLTGQMQGRILKSVGGKSTLVEVIPPVVIEAPVEQSGEENGDESAPTDESSEGESEPTYREDGESVEEQNAPPVAIETSLEATWAPAIPQGHAVTLEAGTYTLATEHSRGDVGVSYRIHLGAETLTPNMARDLTAPVKLNFSVPKSGLARIVTTGETDVRCRVFQNGKLVAENSGTGSDWNCTLIQALEEGDYELHIESETQKPGATRVRFAMPTSTGSASLVDGQNLSLTENPLEFSIPANQNPVVVSLKSVAKEFGCALESNGRVWGQQNATKDCTYFVNTGSTAITLRTWSLSGTMSASAALKILSLKQGGDEIPRDGAVKTSIPLSGKYKTSAQVMCALANVPGAFRWCGPDVSLEKGDYVFAGALGRSHPLPLSAVDAIDDAKNAITLFRRPTLQQLKASAPALFVVESVGQNSSSEAPQCRFDSIFANEIEGNVCIAASAPSTEVSARLWTAGDTSLATITTFRKLTKPTSGALLSLGTQTVDGAASASLRTISAANWSQVNVSMPRNSLAIFLNEKDEPTRVCRSGNNLKMCSSTQKGGSVLIESASPSQVSMVSLDGPGRSATLSTLFEQSVHSLTQQKLLIPSADKQRIILTEGTSSCWLRRSDGTSSNDCRAALDANLSAELIVRSSVPWRSVAFVETNPKEKCSEACMKAKLTLDLPVIPGAALSSASAQSLSGNRVDRTILLSAPTAVRLQSSSGTCGLFDSKKLIYLEGLENGCDFTVALKAGSYRFLVRGFADANLSGRILRTDTPSISLQEGVGNTLVLAPENSQLYSFAVPRKGQVGIGIQAKSELLECQLFEADGTFIQSGCHQFLSLEKKEYVFAVKNPAGIEAKPIELKPVIFGLKENSNEIPEDYLKSLFQRAEAP